VIKNKNQPMKKIYFILIFLVVSFVKLSAQSDAVNTVLQNFPYQRLADATASLNSMQTWSKGDWKKLLTQLDDTDSLRLKPTLALSAYVHHIALDAKLKSATAVTLSSAINYVKSFYGRALIIEHLAYLGDDAAVKTLSKLLSSNSVLIGNAARALATIHSKAAIDGLNKGLKKAIEPARSHIQAALDNANSVLPEIKPAFVVNKKAPNNVQQLLDLQDRLTAATNPLQKQQIIAAAARIPGFTSFMMAGRSLNDAAVNEEAALIVARMALADKSIRGKAVREVLEQALPLIKGADSAILVPLLKSHIALMPYDNGFVSLFNGKDLSGWKALVGNPIARSKMTATELEEKQKATNEKTKGDWVVKDGLLIFTGHGDNLATEKQYGDFEMFVDWKITEKGDAGIYLRGTPQVQIWDTSRREVGAQVGSGGLYNNQKNNSKPLVVADNKIGQWNTFHIIMKGDKVTVYLNGVLVTDNTVLENYWDRKLPIFSKEQIELQAHGTYVAYRNIYLKEITPVTTSSLNEEEKKQGFTMLFDGSNMDHWMGNTDGYQIEEGVMVVHPELGHGNLYTKEEYANFDYRFEFQLTPGSNNGLGIRAPLKGDAAYVGSELQILDNEAAMYKDLQPYQYHGSVYGVIAAKRGYLLPIGEWNKEEVVVNGTKIKVTLNGTVILDGDIKESILKGTADHKEHPGLKRTTGHIGYLGHGDVMRFRNIRVKAL